MRISQNRYQGCGQRSDKTLSRCYRFKENSLVSAANESTGQKSWDLLYAS